ncbi:unnamed protein product [Dibothriocephalus latus]|uniref:Uncharacterized protein n=1 Tax=Dibothriocephalus latus TaxID=60516 RepID=A0A3P7KZD1_DIBLA|nr:unnamed protein product [Dibothriocephalus latus]
MWRDDLPQEKDMNGCIVNNHDNEGEEEEEDMEAWLDEELKKINSEDIDDNDDNQNASVPEVPERPTKTSEPKEEESLEAEKQDTFSRFFQAFDEFAGSDNVSESEHKDTATGDTEPHLLYKDQLEFALAARNLTFDDYLKTQSLLKNENTPEQEPEETNNNRPASPDLINLQDMKLDDEEIKEIGERWKSSKYLQTFHPQKAQ